MGPVIISAYHQTSLVYKFLRIYQLALARCLTLQLREKRERSCSSAHRKHSQQVCLEGREKTSKSSQWSSHIHCRLSNATHTQPCRALLLNIMACNPRLCVLPVLLASAITVLHSVNAAPHLVPRAHPGKGSERNSSPAGIWNCLGIQRPV